MQRLSDELTLTDMAHLALFNLTVDTTQKYYDLDKHVIPFLGRHWEYFSPCEEVGLQYFHIFFTFFLMVCIFDRYLP